MEYRNIITMDPGKRSGKPCIRHLRITVYDILEYLASGMSIEQILLDFPEFDASLVIVDWLMRHDYAPRGAPAWHALDRLRRGAA